MVEKVSFLVYLKDQMSGGLAKLAGTGNSTLTGLASKQRMFTSATVQSETAVVGLDSKMKNLNTTGGFLGKTLKTAMAGFGIFMMFSMAGRALEKFNVQAQADTQIVAGIASTNRAAGVTFKELAEQAEALQKVTLFGNEETEQGQSLLLTFKNIHKEIFMKTIPVLQDVATKMHYDLKSAALQVGKAMNDPISGLTMLTRVGITFSNEQKKVIKALTESGNVAGAQTIILNELISEFGGASRAAALAGTGGLKQLKNLFGDMSEKVGGFIYVLIQGLNPALSVIVNSFGSVFGWLTKYASIIKPLITGISIVVGLYGMWTAAQWALNASMAVNPIFLIILSLGALVGGIIYAWNKFEGFRKAILGLWGVVKLIFGLIKNIVILEIGAIIDIIKLLWAALKSVASFLKDTFWGVFKTVFKVIKSIILTDIKIILAPIMLLWSVLKSVASFLKDTFWGVFKSVFEWIGHKVASIFGMFWKLLSPVLKLLGLNTIVSSVTTAFTTGAAGGVRPVAPSPSGGSNLNPLAGALGTPGSGSDDSLKSSTLSGNIAGSGSGGGKNITISLNSLIDKFEIHTDSIKESYQDIKEKVTEVLLEAINDANLATG